VQIAVTALYAGAGQIWTHDQAEETPMSSRVKEVQGANAGGGAPAGPDEPRSWNMDPALLEKALTDRSRRGTRPRAVIVVHVYGQPADMDPIVEICTRREVPPVEDAVESLGATQKGRQTGTIDRGQLTAIQDRLARAGRHTAAGPGTHRKLSLVSVSHLSRGEHAGSAAGGGVSRPS